MIAWIADLLGQGFLELGAGTNASTLRGIVLLDEVDLHLHPTWQRRIIPILKRVFPELQFIVTTHSPLVLSGFESDEIIQLALEDGLVVQRPLPIEPGMLTASEILTSYFDVPRAGRPDLVQKERAYLELKAKSSRSEDEEQRMLALGRELSPYWMRPAEEDDENDDEDEGLDEPAEASS
jgi:predicted ATP-binding protein involved in virulence